MKNIYIVLVLLFSSIVVLAQDDLNQQLFLEKPVLIAQATPEIEMTTDQPMSVSSNLEFKNKGKAFFLSLLLPGLGERYVGNSRKAQVFMATELSLWLSYTGFVTYREWRKDDYITYAATHAGVETEGKPESFYVDIGNYSSIYEYNATKLRDRNLPEYYYDEKEFFWEWDSATDKHNFKQLRLSADRADNRATFIVGAILANHLISAIDAVWDVYKHNKSVEQSAMNFNIHMGPVNNDSRSIGVKLAASF